MSIKHRRRLARSTHCCDVEGLESVRQGRHIQVIITLAGGAAERDGGGYGEHGTDARWDRDGCQLDDAESRPSRQCLCLDV